MVICVFLKAFFSKGEGEQKAIGLGMLQSVFTANIIFIIFDFPDS
jgi:hypothetical protein